MAETKSVGALQIKNADRGEVEAVVATLNVVDHELDVILPGAIPDQARVKMSFYGHGAMFGDAPVGKGIVREVGNRAVLTGQFFMGTERGREAFETVKALGADSEWSIGYRPETVAELTPEWRAKGARRLLQRIALFEVSPVLRGASRDTMTLGVKQTSEASEFAAIFAQNLAREVRAKERERVEGLRRIRAQFVEREAMRAKNVEEYALRCRYRGSPPPVGLTLFLALAKARLGITARTSPHIVMVKEFEGAPNRLGVYTPSEHLVRVRDDLTGLELHRTLAHELAHSKEAIEGREHSEDFAEAAAEDVLVAWNRFCYP